MRYLLHIRAQLPGDWPEDRRAELSRRQEEAAVELMRRKILLRTFRVVGQSANFSIWETDTLEELHAVLQSNPMYPFWKIRVIPIIKHPAEKAYEQHYGELPPL